MPAATGRRSSDKSANPASAPVRRAFWPSSSVISPAGAAAATIQPRRSGRIQRTRKAHSAADPSTKAASAAG